MTRRLLDHRNLVKLEGICRGPFSLVMEFLSQGTLYDYVHAYECLPYSSSYLS